MNSGKKKEKEKEKEKEKIMPFYATASPFSQWHPCKFQGTPMFGINKNKKYTFNSSEKWMMYNKALLFDDYKIAEKIMKSNSAKTIKQLGRNVRGFNNDLWDKHKKHIVYKGNELKFNSSPKLLHALLKTKGYTLVEASPYDKIWGVGMRSTNKRIHDRNQWKGQNLLGEILTELRENLLKKEEKIIL